MPKTKAEEEATLPPTGQTSQRYDGETDVAVIIKRNNEQREYKQAGLPWPPEGVGAGPLSIDKLEPSSAEIGGVDVGMTVTGTGFAPTSKIVFNGGEEVTNVISDTECSTTVKPSLAQAAVDVPVLVRTDMGTSNTLTFSFTEPVVRKSAAKAKDEDEDKPVAKTTKAKTDDDYKYTDYTKPKFKK